MISEKRMWQSKMSGLGWKVSLTFGTVSLGLTFPWKYYDFHLNSYRNMNFLRHFHYKYIRNQTGIAIKKVMLTQIHHLCIPGRTHIPNATYQVLRPLVVWFQIHMTINICYKLTPLNLWSLHTKFEFIWPSSFWETVWIYWWDSNMRDLAERSKELSPLGLIYSHCLNRFNISSGKYDFGCNIFQNKSTFYFFCPI